MRHEAAPKPRLTMPTTGPDYLSDTIGVEQRLEWTAEKFFVTTDEEPLFDAADVLRFGKDLVVQHGFTTNLKGIDWLTPAFPRAPGPRGELPRRPLSDPYRRHLHAAQAGTDHEQPGAPAARRPARPVREQRLGDRRCRAPGAQCAAAALLFERLAVDERAGARSQDRLRRGPPKWHQLEQLDKLGFEVIPVPFRDAYAFGGGLHCATADVYREGDCEDYFPTQPA